MQKDKIKNFLDSSVIAKGEECKTIALPCLAKLELIHLLKAIETGAKGVAVWGCADKDCQYIVGNRLARGRLSYGQRILKEIGMEDFILQHFDDGPENSGEMEKRFDNWLKKVISVV